MPVATKVWLQLGHDDEVSLPDLDGPITSGADVPLAGGIRLHGCDDLYPEKAAHASNTAVTKSVMITTARSTVVLCRERNGLKPIGAS